MPIVHSERLCFVVYLFDAVSRRSRSFPFWQLVLRASGKACSFGFPLTVFVILLVWCLLHHRLVAPCAETHYSLGFAFPASPCRLLFKLDVVRTHNAILLVCVWSFKKRSAADTESIHRIHRLSFWPPGCAFRSTGSAFSPSTTRCLLRSGTRPVPSPASIVAFGLALCKNTSPALTSLFDDERGHFPAGCTAQTDAFANPCIPVERVSHAECVGMVSAVLVQHPQ